MSTLTHPRHPQHALRPAPRQGGRPPVGNHASGRPFTGGSTPHGHPARWALLAAALALAVPMTAPRLDAPATGGPTQTLVDASTAPGPAPAGQPPATAPGLAGPRSSTALPTDDLDADDLADDEIVVTDPVTGDDIAVPLRPTDGGRLASEIEALRRLQGGAPANPATAPPR